MREDADATLTIMLSISRLCKHLEIPPSLNVVVISSVPRRRGAKLLRKDFLAFRLSGNEMVCRSEGSESDKDLTTHFASKAFAYTDDYRRYVS